MIKPTKGQPLLQAEAERMFDYYCKVRRGGGIQEVGRKFKRARSSVYRVANRDDWNKRLDKIESNVQKRTDKNIERREIKNLQIVTSTKKKVAKAILGDNFYKSTVAELISLIRLEEELSGGLPGEGIDGDTIVNIINDHSDLVRFLENAAAGAKAGAASDRGPFSTI